MVKKYTQKVLEAKMQKDPLRVYALKRLTEKNIIYNSKKTRK